MSKPLEQTEYHIKINLYGVTAEEVDRIATGIHKAMVKMKIEGGAKVETHRGLITCAAVKTA